MANISQLALVVFAFISTSTAMADAPTLIQRCGTVIDRPGNYLVDRDLVCPVATTNAITIQNTREVKLSLGGHKITGSTTQYENGGTAILIVNTVSVTVSAPNAQVEKFYTAVHIDKSAYVNVSGTFQYKFKVSPTQNAVTVQASLHVTIGDILATSAPNLGFYAVNTNDLLVSDFNLGSSNQSGSEGFILMNVTNAQLKGITINMTPKALQITSCGQVQISNLAISKTTTGLWMSGNQGVTVKDATIASGGYGVQLGQGDDTGVTFQNVKITGPNTINVFCRVQHPTLPTLINVTPAVITECHF